MNSLGKSLLIRFSAESSGYHCGFLATDYVVSDQHDAPIQRQASDLDSTCEESDPGYGRKVSYGWDTFCGRYRGIFTYTMGCVRNLGAGDSPRHLRLSFCSLSVGSEASFWPDGFDIRPRALL